MTAPPCVMLRHRAYDEVRRRFPDCLVTESLVTGAEVVLTRSGETRTRDEKRLRGGTPWRNMRW